MNRRLCTIVWLVGWSLVTGVSTAAVEPRCVVVDLYATSTDEAAAPVLARLEAFAAGRDGLIVVRRFPDTVPADQEALAAAATREKFAPDDLPVVVACGTALAGCRDPAAAVSHVTAAVRMELFTRRGCGRCRQAKEWLPNFLAGYPGLQLITSDLTTDAAARSRVAALVDRHRTAAASVPVFHLCDRLIVGFDRPEAMGPRLAGILESWTRPCREAIGTDDEAGDETIVIVGGDEEAIDLPWLGRLDAGRLGMPLFTLAVGLVDGFNPCAMWVLLLLLSILVNLRDRMRILAIAGTFVVVSGLAYFAFMAAWLNVFQWIGMLRPVQIALGSMAVAIGLVHIKDFFAFKQGPSLSIPESAKPGIYTRIRRIVNAENLPAAVAGAFILAVLVNMVELLCTAGLPAMYTGILTQRGYSTAVRYGYLGLYIAAYMFDDALMVAGVVISLSRIKLQETGGRWLKLVSGGVVLALGLVMLVRPGWLEG
ncbi:MAG: NrdH-redoxin [Planctomycetota bacterium]|nr:NrdH-redoxin [Planctomycetota bacterium]